MTNPFLIALFLNAKDVMESLQASYVYRGEERESRWNLDSLIHGSRYVTDILTLW